jgi:beta-glucosidase
VLVLLNGGAVSGDFYTSVPAVVEAFYPGALGGEALAQTLFGLSSPAGRLPFTIVKSLDDLPADYSSMGMADAPGRTHRYFSGEPGFAFGFGLSYTTFNYDGATASLQADGSISVTCRVRNLGALDSDDVVLVFVGGSKAEGAPRQGLVGFQRVSVPHGDARIVKVSVSSAALAAQGFPATAPPTHLTVGGRAPGSPGAWVDAKSVPPAPLEVPIEPASFYHVLSL